MDILSSVHRISIKETFKAHWTNYLAAHQDSFLNYISATIEKMLSCGDPEKPGYHKYVCSENPEVKRELKVFREKKVLDAFFNPFLLINWYVYDSTDLERRKVYHSFNSVYLST